MRIPLVGAALVALLGAVSVGLHPVGAQNESNGAEPTDATPPSDVNPDDFVERVDNPYFPLTPGTTLEYDVVDDEGNEGTLLSEVTDESRTILGVDVTVVHERETIEGELKEETFDWFAQDAAGNVWYFGEDTRELEGGEVVSTAGSWEAGVDGARAGIIMHADVPFPGGPYFQEFAPDVAVDQGEDLRIGETVAVPFGSFDDVLVTREFTELEPDVEEEKFYAPGIGFVRSEAVRGGSEVVELVDVRTEPLEGGGTCVDGLAAEANANETNTLTWDAVEGAEAFTVLRAIGPGAFAPLANVSGDASSFTDEDVDAGVSYRYAVAADGAPGEDCEIAEVTTVPVFPSWAAGVLIALASVGAVVVLRRRTT